MVDITEVSTKFIYKILLWTEYKTPTAVHTWQKLCSDQDHIHLEGMWEHWWSLPYRLAREVRLQAFCYRILNRVIPCNVYLKQICFKNSEVCSYCQNRDDLYHFFYGCNDTALFWKGVCKRLRENSGVITFPRKISELEFYSV